MLKRLIEVAMPLKEVSEQSVLERKKRHGQISNLHIWWARRPLAACRAVVFASLIPDPDDPECPDEFRKLVMEVLSKSEFKPTNGDGSSVEDTPRNRCLEFIKVLVRFENTNDSEYVEPASKLIANAHNLLHPAAKEDMPKVLDPFAGGGAIPLEVLRLGCESHAIDLNPVAHLIELCTLVYPQKFGQPDSRPVPDYINRLIAHNRTKKNAGSTAALFEEDGESAFTPDDGEIIPDVQITEAEYRKNPLSADVKYWGHWVLASALPHLAPLYATEPDGSVPVAYLWARTVTCPNPACQALIPLVRSLWLCKKANRRVAVKMVQKADKTRSDFVVVEGRDIDFDPDIGTMKKGRAQCPHCEFVITGETLRHESKARRMGQQLLAVMSVRGRSGKLYRSATDADYSVFDQAKTAAHTSNSPVTIPDEELTPDRPSPNSRGLSAVARYGFTKFGDLFNARQGFALTTLAYGIQRAFHHLSSTDQDYARAVVALLACNLDRLADLANTLCRFEPVAQCPRQLFGRQAVAMVWDYAEGVPISGRTCSWQQCLDRTFPILNNLRFITTPAVVQRGSATSLPFETGVVHSIVVDPPYYDSVPYSDLSDFFFVWLKRALPDAFPDLFRTPLTPKSQEVIAYYGKGKRKVQKTPEWYEDKMRDAFSEMRRVLSPNGVISVMFAHKTTSAWESLIAGLMRSGLVVTASWPLHTEMATRLVARNTAALASSITLVCRGRGESTGSGLWDDVRQQLKSVAKERLDFFWNQGIRGADFFISAIGPALSVFGKYERVTKLSGEEVTVGQFLDEVRSLVTSYALAKILKTTHTAPIDPESRFYVVWKWSYDDAKVPADESFKMAQALGIDTEEIWDGTGVLHKSGENVNCVPIPQRMKIKDLGEPSADGAPASLIDVLHRMCAYRDKNDSQGMAQFLGNSGHANNPTLWLVAQAVSESLPDGDKEKQLMQGLLNQREGLEEATRQRELF